MSKPTPKYCFIDPLKGQIIMTLTAEEEFIAGGDFKIINTETKETIEEWKLTADFGRPTIYKIQTDADELHKAKLVWNVLICTKNANRFEGKLGIKFFQKRKPCKMSSPSSYILLNVPPCALQSAENLTGSLFFIVKEKLEEIIKPII